MDIQEEREAFETWLYSTEKFKCRNKIFLFMLDENGCYEDNPVLEHWETWQAAKAQAVPNTQALHDRLLVKSIREHVESHISEISVNDLFDKGWLAAMKCIQNNIDMLEAQEPAND